MPSLYKTIQFIPGYEPAVYYSVDMPVSTSVEGSLFLRLMSVRVNGTPDNFQGYSDIPVMLIGNGQVVNIVEVSVEEFAQSVGLTNEDDVELLGSIILKRITESQED